MNFLLSHAVDARKLADVLGGRALLADGVFEAVDLVDRGFADWGLGKGPRDELRVL